VDDVAAGSRPVTGEALDYLGLRCSLREAEAGYLPATTGSSLEVDGVRVDFFAPQRPLIMVDGPDPWGARSSPPGGEELNAGSLVAVIDCGETEFLLPGDAEAEVLEGYDLPPLEMVLVPHHGSRGACTSRLLARLQVRSAAVSVGEDNPFGHPDGGTMDLLQNHVSTVLRTDQAGWVCYTTDGMDLALTSERNTAP
jgi:beta-lactamase superfamily II metal-dependent hydrolase